jgi:hypothetical protein
MTDSCGILMFAHNNSEINYGKIAYVSACYVEKALSVPVSLVTNKDTIDRLVEEGIDYKKVFDKIILTDGIINLVNQFKDFYDGNVNYKTSKFDNGLRFHCYDLSPYDKTLVMDIDLFLMNDNLNSVWETDCDFMINQKHYDLSFDREDNEFKRLSDIGIDFYWATVFYFKKTKWTKTFFDLCLYIIDNYEFYKLVYGFAGHLMRNDYVVSMAIHMLYGFDVKTRPYTLPAEIYYILDRDELIDIKNSNEMIFLLEKKNSINFHDVVRTTDHNVHIMNKYSITRMIPRLLEVLDE